MKVLHVLMAITAGVAVAAPTQSMNYDVQVYGDGIMYKAMCVADIDNDEQLEVIMGNRAKGSFEVWGYDKASGQMKREDSILFLKERKANPHSVSVADFDNDGDMDIVVCYEFFGMFTGINQGESWKIAHLDSTYGNQVLTADFDGDKKADILFATNSGGVRVYYGKGDGSFERGNSLPSIEGSNHGNGFTVVDFNKDGRLDLIGSVCRHFDLYGLAAYMNTIDDGVVRWVTAGKQIENADQHIISRTRESVLDLDGDGLPEKVAGQKGGRVVVWRLGENAGGKLDWELELVDQLEGLADTGDFLVGVADFNNDGAGDIYAAGFSHYHGLVMFYGSKKGRYTRQHVGLGCGLGSPESLVTVDLNGDGLLDIVSSRYACKCHKGGFVTLLSKTVKTKKIMRLFKR
ncbi:MAG: VCBS repeat-containing protein [Kiritimatiellae bacterium]|nr:VCBS repeat-containing protein [Kiritimatiellia bacterium]